MNWNLPDRAAGDPVQVMGILNVTPDSFSDGGELPTTEAAINRAREMVAAGADLLDVGGESTRPGAEPVSEAEELDRVVPIIERLAAEVSVPISVDTSKAAVMAAAVRAGAAMINDVNALRAEAALATAAELGVPVCLMHMQGEPRSMQAAPRYDDVVADVGGFLKERVAAARAGGIDPDKICVDPGFGFGKSLAHNVALLRGLGQLTRQGEPVLVGLSRKSMLGEITGRPVDQRVVGSAALALLAAQAGASIVRVHDVAPTVDALRVLAAVTGG